MGYGLDLQTSPKYKHKTLGPVAIAGAEEVVTALVNVGAIRRGNGVLYAASKQSEQCTFEGMKVGFQEQAKKVGQNGLFVFHFSGHGIKVRDDEWGLAPVDFDYTRENYLTADVLNQWLKEVGCKAKYVLLVLDCCYAGKIANDLAGNWSEKDLGLYVISACTANEASLVLGPLGHSIFTYFLAQAISKLTLHPGQLPVHEIFKECQACSVALSSLLIKYDPQSGLSWSTMQPQMGEGSDQPDGTVGGIEFLFQFFDLNKPNPSLDDKTHAWLETLPDTKGPLMELERRHILQGKVLDAALCSMMYSIASIEMAFNYTNVDNPNLFLRAFMHAVTTLDEKQPSFLEVNIDQLLQSLEFYHEVVVQNKGNESGEELRKLYYQLIRKKRIDSGEDSSQAEKVGIVCKDDKTGNICCSCKLFSQ